MSETSHSPTAITAARSPSNATGGLDSHDHRITKHSIDNCGCPVGSRRPGYKESACRPGLVPGPVRPATMRRKLPMTCDYTLSGSRRLAVDDSTMCPARLGILLARSTRCGGTLRLVT